MQQRLDDLVPLIRGDTVLDAVAVAIAVEDCFGIVLTDDDIAPSRLCHRAALEATVERHLSRDR